MDRLPTTLVDLLSNSLVLRGTAPYITIRDLLNLSSTCRALRQILRGEPDAWRHLNLTTIKRAVIDSSPIDVGGVSWRAERMDESLTEDDFYAGPLRGIFNRLHSQRNLKHVQTLILDGLSVPADLIREIVAEDRYQVRILSIRRVKNLNPNRLQQVLRYVCRPTREEGTPRLKALYYFGPKDAPLQPIPSLPPTAPPSLGVMSSPGAQIGASWNARSSELLKTTLISSEESQYYSCTGRVLKKPYSDWAETLQVCHNIIHFDAVLCRGPRHDISKTSSKDFLQPTIATVALGPGGCETCHSCPELPASFPDSPPPHLPLLGPVPTHSSTVRSCIRPDDPSSNRLILRCEDCLRGRWCEQCNRWWCEDCYEEPVSRSAHHLRTEMQTIELRDQIRSGGWSAMDSHVLPVKGQQTKVDYTAALPTSQASTETASNAAAPAPNAKWISSASARRVGRNTVFHTMKIVLGLSVDGVITPAEEPGKNFDRESKLDVRRLLDLRP
ncbi:unnamed protein product [Zymoseptoria tritici ST99CH_1A5]|uniref:F-box domain-containing protein n=1 Tax=Zymoseptoria tritici ST99CH_1A5 TaxID=1276529 RepID=A0A1Y6L8E2_ZYMTR|nr:unnamed protein product [Zymoseptoria tritici ST99CH_3D1]SMY20753.1 unnamed protein product [Zymoseptoria tritici ST99CH_1A5]